MSKSETPTFSDLGCFTVLLLLSPLLPDSVICVAVNFGQKNGHPDEIRSKGPVFNLIDTAGNLACDVARYVATFNALFSPDGFALTPVLAVYTVSVVQTMYLLHKSSSHARKGSSQNRQ